MVSQWGFDLHYVEDWRCWATFNVLAGHLHIFEEMSVQAFYPFFMFFVFIYFLLSCTSYLCILDINTLADI